MSGVHEVIQWMIHGITPRNKGEPGLEDKPFEFYSRVRGPVIIACGGTGGHLAPGIALAQFLQKEGREAILLISQKEVDLRLLEPYPTLRATAIPSKGLAGGFSGYVRAAAAFFKGFRQLRKLFKETKPAVVVGFGGFVTFTAVAAGVARRVSYVLHEANRPAGKTTRWLAPWAQCVYAPEGVSVLRAKELKTGGFPVRSQIKKIPQSEARAQLDFPQYGRLVIVMGGSQGAQSLSNWAFDNAQTLLERGIHLCAICGMADKRAPARKEAKGLDGQLYKAQFLNFCDAMASLMCAADLAVSRSGAGALAELARCELPSILIPYPYATSAHQDENAQDFAQRGCADVLDQKNIDQLLSQVIALLGDREKLSVMKESLQAADQANQASVKQFFLDVLSAS